MSDPFSVRSFIHTPRLRSAAAHSFTARLKGPGALAALLMLAACASGDSALLSEEPGFAAGFGDGCSTAREENKSFSTKRVRDEYQFESDRAYRAGWRQGYLECDQNRNVRRDGGRILGDEDRP